MEQPRRRVAYWHAMLKLMHLDRGWCGGVCAAPGSAPQPEILTVEVLRGGGGGGGGGSGGGGGMGS